MTHQHTITNSSMLSGCSWLDGTLTVTFRNGKEYIYEDVPFGTYIELKQAESAGTYYNSKIKGFFSHPQPPII